MLATCPQVTAIHGKHADQVVPSVCWDILLAFPALPLVQLSMKQFAEFNSQVATDMIEYALTAHPFLEVMHVDFLPLTDTLLASIALYCPLLEEFTASMGTASIASIGQLLRLCRNLQIVGVLRCRLDLRTTDLDCILEAAADHPQLEVLRILFPIAISSTQPLFLHAFLNMPSDLQLLQVGRCCFDRKNGRLSLLTPKMDIGMLNLILDNCTNPIRHLRLFTLPSRVDAGVMDLANEEREVFDTLGERVIGGFLLKLTIELIHPTIRPMPRCLLYKCPKLQHLTFRNFAMTEGELHEVASHCHELKQLCMAECSNHSITDDGMEELFAGCPLLEYLHVGTAPNLTMRTLQAIVQHKLRLKRLTWKRSMPAFGEEGLSQFRDIVREQQLLPIPVLTASNPCAHNAEMFIVADDD